VADKKKVVRRTAAERMAALEQELRDLELKEVEKARKTLSVKLARLAKVFALIKKYEAEAEALDAEIDELQAIIDDKEDVVVETAQAEEVSTSLSAAG